MTKGIADHSVVCFLKLTGYCSLVPPFKVDTRPATELVTKKTGAEVIELAHGKRHDMF